MNEMERHFAGVLQGDLKKLPGLFVQNGAVYLRGNTYYDTTEEQEEAILEQLNFLFELDRDLALGLALFPRLTEATRALVVDKAIRDRIGFDENRWLTPKQERELLLKLLNNMSISRALRTLARLVDLRVNNARTQKLIKAYVYGSITPWRAVKYRDKYTRLLRHVYGENYWYAMSFFSEAELKRQLPEEYRSDSEKLNCLAFLLNPDREWDIEVFSDFTGAKQDPELLLRLPLEVALGLRAKYHPDYPASKLYEQANVSNEQKARLVTAGKRHDVEINLHWSSVTARFIEAVVNKNSARLAALFDELERLPKNPRYFAIVDISPSMQGVDGQTWRRLATAIETAYSSGCTVLFTGDWTDLIYNPGVRTPRTKSLALIVAETLEVMEAGDTLFIFSDGYENVVDGLTNLVVKARPSGVRVFHIVSVFDASKKHTRWLTDEIFHQIQSVKVLELDKLEADLEDIHELFNTPERQIVKLLTGVKV